MPLSVEELLKLRIKRINKWPGMSPDCPELLKISGDHFYFPFGRDMELGWSLSSLPEWSHLVKPLEWWEERMKEQMPKYVRFDIKASMWHERYGDIVEVFNWYKYPDACIFHNHFHASILLPATHEEYLAYTNSLTTKQTEQ